MKTFKIPLFLFAMALAIGGAIAAVAPAKVQPTFTVYHYTSDSDDPEELKNFANWQGTTSEPGCDVNGTIPCTFSYSGDFEQYLANLEDAEELIENADSRRTP